MSSVITFSKAMPLRMVFTDLENLSADNPENILFKNMGHPYFDTGEWVQLFEKTDELIIQFKSSFNNNAVKLMNYLDDSEVQVATLDEEPKSGYSIIEAAINLANPPEGYYYVFAYGNHSDGKTFSARSEPFQIKTKHSGSILIEYYNFEDFAEYRYTSGHDNQIRVNGMFVRPANQNENESMRDSAGLGIKISDDTIEGKLLEVYRASSWMIEKINLCLAHDKVKISGIPVIPDSKLEYDFGFHSLVGSPSVEVPIEQSLLKNSHDSLERVQQLKRVTNLVAIGEQLQIRLTWESDNNGNETGFRIERSPSGLDGSWSVIHTTASEVLTYLDDNDGSLLESGEDYFYKIETEGINPSGYSGIATATVLPLSAPSDVILTPGLESIQIDFTSNSQSSEDGFEIYRSLNGVSGWVLVTTTGTNDTSYLDDTPSLNHTTQYYYRARSKKGSVFSDYSTVVSATTLTMLAPDDLILTPTLDSVTVTWTSNSGGEEDGFELWASVNGIDGWELVDSVGSGVTTTKESGLTQSTIRHYRVRAIEEEGNSPYSSVVMTATLTLQAPSNLVASLPNIPSQIQIDFESNSSGQEDGFIIERTLFGTSNWTEIKTLGKGVTSFINKNNVVSTNQYSFRAKAIRISGDSAYSNIDTIQIQHVATMFGSVQFGQIQFGQSKP